jgi:hypothetical protein
MKLSALNSGVGRVILNAPFAPFIMLGELKPHRRVEDNAPYQRFRAKF